jgi:hypothetical protein
MRSLSAHLATSGEHGGLAFHPACPVCRGERLLGRLTDPPLVGRRAQAGVLVWTLAVSGATPALAAAAVEREASTTPADLRARVTVAATEA